MPFYREKLLSALGNDRVFEVGKPVEGNVDIPNGARRGPGNTGHIAANPRTRFRNQVARALSAESNVNSATEPKYLSDKSRALENGESEREDVKDITGAFARFALSSNSGDAPHGYGELRIRYGGPRGVQDFDFG